MKRFWAVLKARNIEFWRDRAALGWNLLFPVLLLVGFSFVFSDEERNLYKVGILLETGETTPQQALSQIGSPFAGLKYVEFIPYQNAQVATDKVARHQLDLLVDFNSKHYWLNESSRNGYFMSELLRASHPDFEQSLATGRAIRYVDWVLPGVLGMNMMFSCLFGVGYVIVRYRKNGVLKRMQATPLSAFEFICAQVLSRLAIVVMVSSMLFIGCDLMLDFYILGSLWNLLTIGILGAASLISLGLLIACRLQSEELTGGLLNLASWPMMFLSGVWFSLEGAPELIQQFALIFPLTHLVEGARAILTEGASLYDIRYNLMALIAMTLVFLGLGASLFSWGSER